ncbi:MAG: hypothetical protein WCE79_25760 [Xanthobacteraceae bacterium]
MPRARRARDRRSRGRKKKRREDSSLLLDIEEPLRDAAQYVEALRLIGHGLELHDETGGNAVAALARIAALRLRVVEETWNKVLDERQAS